ncbi:MAG: InlB B-repeat-containing protein [Clostridia bacterium]|nr:InlB B-repeat-containing protein [Clostridia bacterium]
MPAHDVEIDVLYYLYVAPTYTVTFVDWNGAVIDTQVVSEGEAATAPNDPTREGYTFTGWDKDFSNVTEDITVTAQYRINTYTVTINYYRWSDVLEDWVAAIDAKTFTYEYGAEYDMTDMIPEDIDGNLRDHIEGVVSGTMPAENVVINAYYVKPYEPTAPTVEAETVELRERATADGKSDIRFIFKVTFNDSYVVEGEDNYGPTEEYYKITRLYVEMVRSDNSTPRTLECKNLYTVSDDSFEFTVVIKNIPATGNDVVFTMTPYIDYTYNGVNGTATNTPIESSVNMVGQND